MGWKKIAGWINDAGQSLGFWIPLMIAAAGGSLAWLAVMTKTFQQWAPFSYGLAFWLGVLVVVWCLPPLTRLLPKRERHVVRLGRQVQHHADAAISTLRTEDMFGLNPQTYYKSVTFLVDLEKAGFSVPSLDPSKGPKASLEILAHYFSAIAPLMIAGHGAEAKEAALSISKPTKR